MDISLIEFSCVTFFRGPSHLAHAMHLIVLPLAVIKASTGECHPSLTVALSIDPLTVVEGAIWPLVGPGTSHFVVLEFALVDVSLGHLVVTDAMASSIYPLTFITASIWVPHLAIAFTLIKLPVTLIVGSISPRCLTFAVTKSS